MRYVLGIDSGGTKYRVRAAGMDGRLLGEEYTGTTCGHYLLGQDEMLRRINHHIDACLATFGGHRADCAALVCGTTGYDSEEDGVLLNTVYQSLPGFCCPTQCMNDAQLAHYTVTGGVGVLVISGGGSIGFGRNQKGQTARCGGWLFTIMGDEGSGTWMARMALRHLARWLDGMVPDTLFTQMLREELGISTHRQLMDLAARMAKPFWETPPLSRLADEAAAKGDPYAAEIVRGAASETFTLAAFLADALCLEAENPAFAMGLWGSNAVCSPLHIQTFRESAARRYPQARVLLPEKTATEGAVELALSLAHGGHCSPATI